MVHLYGCTICEEKIPAEDNRIHCRDCGSEICGSCYLRKKTSHFHKADHQSYMIAEYSGSMYVQPPAPPTRVDQRANGATKTTKTTKKAKSAAASTKNAGVKRKRLEDDHVYRPAAGPQTISDLNKKCPNREYTNCARCRKHHQKCSGPTEDGWCQRCQNKNYLDCNFNKAAQEDTSDKEPFSRLSTSLFGSSPTPELTGSTSSASGPSGGPSTCPDAGDMLATCGPSEGPSTSPDTEDMSFDSPQPLTHRRLVSRRNMHRYILDE